MMSRADDERCYSVVDFRACAGVLIFTPTTW